MAEKLNAIAHSVLDPPLFGINTFAIEERNGSGYAITYIPESPAKPHRATKGRCTYFMKTGEGKTPMPHRIVEALIHSASLPELELGIAPSWSGGPPGAQIVKVRFLIRNTGRGIAKNSAFWIKACQRTVETSPYLEWKRGNAVHQNSEAKQGDGVALYENDKGPIFPGQVIEVGNIVFRTSGSDLNLDYQIFAESFMTRGQIEVAKPLMPPQPNKYQSELPVQWSTLTQQVT